MLKVLSWNLNGMGKAQKKWVKDSIVDHKISFLCLQETKTSITQEWQINSIWGGKNPEFLALDSVGNSSGIVTVWDSNLFEVAKTEKNDGIVVTGIWKEKKIKLGIINVYAQQGLRSKKALWESMLRIIRADLDVAWIVCGDFNEVRSAEERKGSVFDPLGASNFNSFISAAGLTDLMIGGRKFMWMNFNGTKLSKLDRFLVNDFFVDKWPSANLIALPRLFSDHCPWLMDTGIRDYGPVPFKMFNSWLSDTDFGQLVRTRWDDRLPEFQVF